MGKVSEDVAKLFEESCCDGGEAGCETSCQPCGCDKGAGWICARHAKPFISTAAQQLVSDNARLAVVQEQSRPTNPKTEVRVTDPVTGGQKGSKLAQLGALDPRALLEVGSVAGFGTYKYARYNFAKGYRWSLSFDALQRHLLAFWDGEDTDPESGLHHVAHAAWHCLALLTFAMRGKGTDDRFPN